MNVSSKKIRSAAPVGVLLAAGSLALAGCASAAPDSGPAQSTGQAAPSITKPAIIEDGVLSVCAALGMGAVPLFYFDESQEPQGIEVDLSREIAASLGLEYREVATAFPSLVPSIEASQCDTVMSSLFITEEREQVVDFVPYLKSGSSLLVKSGGDARVTGFDSTICGKKVSTPAGSSAVLSLTDLSADCEADGKAAIVLTEVDGAATGRQMLLNSQVDVYAGSTADTLYLAAESDGELEVVGEPFEVRTIGAAVKKGNTELADAIEGALQELRESGKYEEILDSVGLGELAYTG